MIHLKLDTGALRELFKGEAGEEIKLVLQRCVLEEFAREKLKAVAQYAKSMSLDSGFSKQVLSDAFGLNEAVKKAVKDLVAGLNELVVKEVNKAFEQEVRKRITDEVQLRLNAAASIEWLRDLAKENQ